MPMTPQEIAVADVTDYDSFIREVAEHCRPVIFRGLVEAWPATRAARESPVRFKDYLAQFAMSGEAEVYAGDRNIAGKYYYSDDLKGFNFERQRMRFSDAVEQIVSAADAPGAPTLYLGSLPVDDCMPGFSAQNALTMLKPGIAPRIWLGHASRVSAHYDTMDNIACVVAGQRRFTLFAPQTIPQLYVGPIDHTMAGQPVSLAASAAPDDPRYPRFREVRDQAIVAELEPGDAIYIPKLWWHQVEATSPFNALINYWWDAFSAGPDAPSTSLLLSMITIAERPIAEREAWKAFFDHYVFRTHGHPLAHLPPDQHGVLGPLKPTNYGRLRARVMQLLRGG
jgi:hypothetical protein